MLRTPYEICNISFCCLSVVFSDLCQQRLGSGLFTTGLVLANPASLAQEMDTKGLMMSRLKSSLWSSHIFINQDGRGKAAGKIIHTRLLLALGSHGDYPTLSWLSLVSGEPAHRPFILSGLALGYETHCPLSKKTNSWCVKGDKNWPIGTLGLEARLHHTRAVCP